MEGAVDAESDVAIGTAKEFIESICKTILDERGEAYGENDDLLALTRKTTKVLQLSAERCLPARPVQRRLSSGC